MAPPTPQYGRAWRAPGVFSTRDSMATPRTHPQGPARVCVRPAPAIEPRLADRRVPCCERRRDIGNPSLAYSTSILPLRQYFRFVTRGGIASPSAARPARQRVGRATRRRRPVGAPALAKLMTQSLRVVCSRMTPLLLSNLGVAERELGGQSGMTLAFWRVARGE
jgi:hypothetical protein